MAGSFFFFVLTVAVGSLMDCYVKGLNQKETGRWNSSISSWLASFYWQNMYAVSAHSTRASLLHSNHNRIKSGIGTANPLCDPVGIQTQDLQNRNLSANSLEIPCVYGLLRLISKTHLRRFGLLILSLSATKVQKRSHTMPSWNVKFLRFCSNLLYRHLLGLLLQPQFLFLSRWQKET